MTFSKKLSRVSNGFEILMWREISTAHNLITVVQTVRKTSHNIEQHLYGFDINWERTQELKTLRSPYTQSVMSTLPLYQRGTQAMVPQECISHQNSYLSFHSIHGTAYHGQSSLKFNLFVIIPATRIRFWCSIRLEQTRWISSPQDKIDALWSLELATKI
jgi:hypothetical protein